jgi:hypothetical protein
MPPLRAKVAEEVVCGKNRLVSAPSHLLPHLLELCSHAVAPPLALQQKGAFGGTPADEGKAQKLEGPLLPTENSIRRVFSG